MGNLDLYQRYAQPPENALKSFNNGRFKGTDINPMWRIKALTEEFGPCGLGWYTKTTRMWREDCRDGTAAVFCEVELYVKYAGEWSAPIVGVGGNTLERIGKNGNQVSDEAYKMAYTDALGIACKALGIGADIWWKSSDGSKYAQYTQGDNTPPEAYTQANTTPPEGFKKTAAAGSVAATKGNPVTVTKSASIPQPIAPQPIDRRQKFEALRKSYNVDDASILWAVDKAVAEGIVSNISGSIATVSDDDFVRLCDGARTVLEGLRA